MTQHGNTGRKLSEEHRRNLILSHKGQVPWMKGRKHTKKSRALIKAARAKQIIKPHTDEAKKKISLAHSGPKSYWWKGGRRVHPKNGHIMILKKDHPHAGAGGYIFEHRLVMEKHLGRFLLPTEIIHHLNKNPADNRIENLHLCANNAEHWKFHLKNRTCEMPNCTKRHFGRGLCGTHHARFYKNYRVK